MKIKIFTQGTNDEFEKLESEVNAWLEQYPSIHIVNQQMSVTAGENDAGGSFVCCVISIFYV